MTIFNPHQKDVLTYGECLDAAMKITDQEDADQYFAAYLKWQQEHMQDASGKHTAEEVCRINLGYYAGYYDNETRERVERLFKCKHPVFGEVAKMGAPSSKEAFECGVQNKTLAELRN